MSRSVWAVALSMLAAAPVSAWAQDSAPAAGSPAETPPRDIHEYVRSLERRLADLERERREDSDSLARVLERLPAGRTALDEAIRSIQVGGYAEFLYSYNLRHGGDEPGRRGDTLGFNQLRAGDADENRFTPRIVRVQVEKALGATGSTGFRVQADYGVAAEIEDADPAFDAGNSFAVPEVNFSWRAPFAPTEHVDLTVGRFRTWLGWETFESDQNWLVTRNPIAVFGTPVTHTGLRAVAPLADKVEVGLAFVNGWDEVRDANDGKTGLVRVALGRFDDPLSSQFQFCASYGSAEGATAQQGDKRRLFEFIWDGKLSDSTEVALDVIRGDLADRSWHGAAGYLRHALTDRLKLSTRLGWYADEALAADGARVLDGTIALAYDLADGFVVSLEYRHDYSRSAGTFLDAAGDPSRHQDTLTASFLYRF